MSDPTSASTRDRKRCGTFDDDDSTPAHSSSDEIRPLKPKHPKVSTTTTPGNHQSSLHKFFSTKNTASSHSSGVSSSATVSPAVMSGIKLYSRSEIEGAKGQDPEYRRSWNKKVQEIYNDRSTRMQLRNKREVKGIIDTSWNLHKVDVLQVEVDEIRKLAEVFFREDERDLRLKSVEKNLDRMRMARMAISQTNEELKGATDVKIKMKLTTTITAQMNELKKAEEALKKAMSRVLDKIKLLQLQQLEIESDKSMCTSELMPEEMQGLVAAAKEDTVDFTDHDD